MDHLQEAQYMSVKEHLDRLRLPTSFPVEAAPLLHKLLQRLEAKMDNHKISTSSHGTKNSHGTSVVNGDSQTKVRALTLQLQNRVRDNNSLHLEHIHLKQENQLLLKKIAKLQANKVTPGEHEQIVKLKNVRQEELESELRHVKQKHNKLLDRAYNRERGLDNLPKEYLEHNIKKEFNTAMRTSITYSSSQQSQAPRNQFELKENTKSSANDKSNRDDIQGAATKTNKVQRHPDILEDKIRNLEAQIKRLHKTLECTNNLSSHKCGLVDGINMNKLLRDFNQKETADRVTNLNHQVDLLVQENKRLSDQIKKVKATAGHAEVLRREKQTYKQKLEAQDNKVKEAQKVIDNLKFSREGAVKKVQIDLESRCKNLQTLKQKADEQLAEKNADIERFKNTIRYLEGQNESKKQKIRNLQAEIRELHVQVDQARNIGQKDMYLDSYKNTNLERDLKSMEAKYSAIVQENSQMAEYLKKFQDKSRECEQSLRQATNLLELKSKELRTKNEQISVLQAMAHEQTRIIQAQKSKTNAENNSLNASLVHTSQESLIGLEKELKTLKNQSSQARRDNQTLQKQVDTLHKELEKDKIEVINITRIKEAKELELRRVSAELSDKEKQLQALRSLEVSFEALKAQARKNDNELHVAKASVYSLQQDKARLNQELQQLSSKLKLNRQAQRKLKADKNELEEKLADAEAENRRLEHDKAEKARRLAEAEQRYARMQTEFETRVGDLEYTKNQLSRLRKQKTSLEIKLQETQSEKQQLESSRARIHSESLESREKEDQIHWLKRELSDLISKLDKANSLNKELGAIANMTKQENQQLAGQHTMLIKEIDQLRARLGQAEAMIIRAQQKENILLLTLQDMEKKHLMNMTLVTSQQNGAAQGSLQTVITSNDFKEKLVKAEDQYNGIMNTWKNLARP